MQKAHIWNEDDSYKIYGILIKVFVYRVFTSYGGCTVIAIYVIYTMLPIRLREAVFGGFLLSFSHIFLAFYMRDQSTDMDLVSKIDFDLQNI